MRAWSVNTWIIVICILVFIIDGFLPTQFVPLRSVISPAPGVAEVPATAMPDESSMIWKPSGVTVALDGVRIAMPPGAVVDRQAPPQIMVINVGTREQPAQRRTYVASVLDQPGGAHIGWAEVSPHFIVRATKDKQSDIVGTTPAVPMPLLEKYLHFSTARGFLKIEFWRLIGFQFLHSHESIMHLLFNMIGLFFFGSMVERYLGSKRYLAFYLLCGIFGALMFVLLNLGGLVAESFAGEPVRIPGLLFNDKNTPLIGASAGVYGVIMAGAFLAPRAMVYVFFVLPMRLSHVAYLIVGIALFTVITQRQQRRRRSRPPRRRHRRLLLHPAPQASPRLLRHPRPGRSHLAPLPQARTRRRTRRGENANRFRRRSHRREQGLEVECREERRSQRSGSHPRQSPRQRPRQPLRKRTSLIETARYAVPCPHERFRLDLSVSLAADAGAGEERGRHQPAPRRPGRARDAAQGRQRLRRRRRHRHALTVVEPTSNGIGSDAFALVLGRRRACTPSTPPAAPPR
jgi:membrane associated rhomboid family serine protease